ncbi:hypothetical protein SAE01_21660 [Segetibacter aerophilus]|uniref:SbsA Ig-like domain-containing protein n=1 Tax=Segetibacter aerophilus TaxID=670293 RepID=A0A512BCI4_9BACT|nr:hypothetical protein SAE01_21660 [Segetibacter aerophilus]
MVWSNDKAVAIAIPEDLLETAGASADGKMLQVRVAKGEEAMLGDLSSKNGHVIFTPLVSLTRGLLYEVVVNNKVIGTVKVPLADAADAPVVLNVYPSSDTLPENLLKIYLRFSTPMREGESLQHVALLDQNSDTVKNVFLDLQPELWNKERTVLTMWLDPGRIKRDLIPNQKLGNPLQKGKQYTLAVANNWKDNRGLSLKEPFTKKFLVGTRDELSPDPKDWQLKIPSAKTNAALVISFGEPLDKFLLDETIRIIQEDNAGVAGRIEVTNQEREILFTPVDNWKPGKYRLVVQSILEDLAGNNLNRPFDRDTKVKTVKTDKPIYERTFEIKQPVSLP